MRYTIRKILLSSIIIGCCFGITWKSHGDENAESAVATRLTMALEFLASDNMKGRAVGSAEIDRAAEYIAEQFHTIGLNTAVFVESPFQEFRLPGKITADDSPANSVQIFRDQNPDEKEDHPDLRLGIDFQPLASGGSGEFDLPLVFVGYGISNSKVEYDEYDGVDVEGKAVVILRKEPQQLDAESVFNGKQPSTHAYFHTKIKNAVKHGAKAVFLINDSLEVSKRTKRLQRRWQRQREKLTQLLAEETSEETDTRHREKIATSAQKLIDAHTELLAADELLAIDGAGATSVAAETPVVFCRREIFREAIESNAKLTLEEIEAEIDKDLKPRTIELTGWSVQGKTTLERNDIVAKNVMAILEGSGSLADQTLIIGAHYDHVGMGGAGSLAPWTTEVHNGADDNASGVAAMLEVARRLAHVTAGKPRRRVLFVAFSGEESGLLGSAHYTREPRFPLENTTAMLNLDMVGRLKGRSLQVHGVGTTPAFKTMVTELADKYRIDVTTRPEGTGPSDHASFNSRKIPVLHFFTGLHGDYHRPSDDVDKIDAEGMERIVFMFSDLAEKVATSPDDFEYRAATRLQLGIRYEFDNGCRVTDVVEGSNAERAGLYPGDILLSIDGSDITKRSELRAKLSSANEGDVLRCAILREKVEQIFNIKLEIPR